MNPFLLSSSIAALLLGTSSALEPLKDSSAIYNQHIASFTLNKLDQNKDGVFKKNENPQQWEKRKKADKNNDEALDLSELVNSYPSYIDSPGKKILNVIFKKADQRNIYLDIYMPDEDTNNKKPVVFYTHGGGWAAGSKHGAGLASFNKVHRALLKEGFCVVSVGYRLVRKDGDTAMRDCAIDSQDALRFISAHHEALGIDPMNMHTFGDSAGGHLAQMVLLSSPDAMQGDPDLAKYNYKTVSGVSWYGPCDFQDSQLFNHDDNPKFRDRFGPRILGKKTNAEDKAKLYAEMSPVTYLTKDSPPLLMIQGDKDTTIPLKQALRMQEALKTIPAPVEITIVKNAGHNWREVGAPIEPDRNEIVQQTIQFLLKHK